MMPTGHMPWTIAHSHVSGHQPPAHLAVLRRVSSQAAVVTAMSR